MASASSLPSGSSGKARGHGEFLRLWESSAPLGADANALCSRVEDIMSTSTAIGRRLTPKAATLQVEREPDVIDAAVGAAQSYEGADGLRGLAAVTTAEEFHAWHAEMERRLKEANDEKFRTMLAGLTADRDACAALLATVASAADAFQAVKARRAEVAETTERFRADCETLVADRKRMSELAEALRRRLTYFEELETLTVKFGRSSGAITPTNPEFVKLLHRLDECVAYASSSTGAVAEADGYVSRFLEVQRRAFTIARDYTVELLRSTSAQVAKELREERAQGAGFRHADLTEASKEYLRFRTIATRVKSLMTELHERAKAPVAKFLPYGGVGGTASASSMQQYSAVDSGTAGSGTLAGNPLFSTRNAAMALYNDCEECFVFERRRLLEPSVLAHIKSIAEVRNMIALARLGSSYVLRVCQLERQLYDYFFPAHAELQGSPVLSAALNSVCDVFYTELRPQILHEDELDKLVYLIEVLKTEILGDEVPRRGVAGAAFAPSAVRAIADAQERIIYRAEVFVRDEIRGFVPTAEDLAYPDKIVSQNLVRAEVLAAARSHPSTPTVLTDEAATVLQSAKTDVQPIASERASPSPSTSSNPSVSISRSDSRRVGIYSTWYPPVERTLRLLSMLYRCVDGQVFAGLAQEAVAICVQSVADASTRVAASGREHAEDHAQLFMIWQLLMIREQISPFDVDMSYTEHELDFFELRSLLGSVIRGQLSVRSLATPPAVREKIVNSKQELDYRVRAACETFILKTTRAILDPVLSFLAKCNAMPANRPARAMRPGEIPSTPPPSANAFNQLKSTPGSFAHPSKLASMWADLETAASTTLPEIVARMKIYVTKLASRAVLLRPVRANVAEAATELLSALQSRYTLEERGVAGVDGAAVTRLLDAIDATTELAAPQSTTSTLSSRSGGRQ
jgi:conserved oligomeric Golgi complex subunit 3